MEDCKTSVGGIIPSRKSGSWRGGSLGTGTHKWVAWSHWGLGGGDGQKAWAWGAGKEKGKG